MMAWSGGMMIPNLRPWSSPKPSHQRHPILVPIEGILRKAFPLVDDEPEGRLSEALAALLVALADR